MTFTTTNRHPAFADFLVAAVASRAIHSALDDTSTRLLSWVLMPDHWHGLIELGGTSALSAAVRLVKGRSSRTVNATGPLDGPLWATGFHDRALRDDDDVVTTARYIVANPVRAHIVEHVSKYPFWNAVWL